MAESNATQVILTDDGLKIIKAQNTADNAAGGVTNLNDPNLMNVIEKQTAVSQYAGLTSQYNVILARAKDANISTDTLTTAYTNLNNFMKALLTDTTKASAVNRDSYQDLVYAYNAALSMVQTALKNSFNSDIDNMHSSVSVASQAASNAVIVASQAVVTGDNANQVASRAVVAANDAQITGDNATSVANKATSIANNASQAASQATSSAILVGSQASSEIAVQSTATAKAQSTANNAFSKAQAVGNQASEEIAVQSTATAKAQSKADDAFSKAQAVGNQASAEILVQSTATAKAQKAADDAFSKATTAIDTGKVTSQAVTDLKDGSKLTIAELENGLATKVANSDYASYKEQTASQIGQLVTNGAFSAYQQTTADLISQKVATKDFSAYQDTTARAISSKVESKDFSTYKSQTADTIASKVDNGDFSTYKTQTAGLIESKVDNGTFSSYKTETANLIAEKVATKDFSTYQKQTADLISSKVATKDFSAYQDTTAKSIESKVESKDFNTYKSQTADAISSKVSTADFKDLEASTRNLALGTSTQVVQANNWYMQVADIKYDKSLGEHLCASVMINNADHASVLARGSATIVIETFDQSGKTLAKVYGNGISYNANGLSWCSVSIDDNTAEVKAYIMTNSMLQNAFYSCLKIEKGTKATPYSPAPEDQVSQSQITQLSGEIEQKVNSGDFSTYKSQTADLIAEKVANNDFSTYQKQTADLISAKVETKDFSSYKDETAKAISSKVESKDFNTYKTQTADVLQTLVSKSPSNIIKDGGFNSAVVGKAPSGWDFSGTAQIAVNSDSLNGLVTPGRSVLQINSKTSGNSDVYYGDWFDVQPGDQFYAELKARWSSMSQKGQIVLGIVTKDATGNWIWTGAVNIGSPGTWAKYTGVLTIPAGAVQGRVWVSWQCSSTANEAVFVTDLVVRPAYSTQSDITQSINNIHLGFKNPNGSNFQMNLSSDGVALLDFSKIMLNGDTNIANGTIGTAQIADAAITNAKIAKLAVGTAQISNAAITDAKIGNVSANKLTAGTIDFNTITGKNINASNITTGKLDTDRLNVNKLSALSADLGDITTGSLKGVNIVANTFSTPNGSFTTDSNGAITAKNMTLNGGTLTSPTINASTINGSTINGTTFNAGDIISNANNTAKYYPMTITPDGAYKSTYFDSAVGLQSSVESGAISYKYRSMIGSGTYLYDNVAINGQGITLDSGTTTTKDTNFSAAETETAYISLTTEAGLYLHGSNANIDFGGHLNDDPTEAGMYMNPYGNLIAKSASQYWQISVAGADNTGGGPVARFGIDSAGSNAIEFNRDLWVNNMGIGTAHQIRSKDGHGIYFTDANSHRVDTYHNNIYYSGSASKSLLSEKTNVTAADVNYWSNLAMSIDLATYNYDTDDYTDPLRLSGVIDDVNATKEWTLPEAFYARDEDGNIVGIDNGVLLNAVLALSQEQAKQIDKLNTNILAMEAKING
ncbi:hypothetical protein [Lactiplantibacillus plantarum]|uniref:hypothetical protein n=1 Tax=Lactiplantibacillus plantarum TaxID=1590 RepID=UPI00254CD92C|nr:hypothetical protein [Lactiplantibacillus plantarum]